MDVTLAPAWRALAWRGGVAAVFAIVLFTWRGLSVHGLVVLFGAYALLDGLFALAAEAGVRAMSREARPWWNLAVEGVLGIAIGMAVIAARPVPSRVLLYVIAGWAIVTGILELATARRIRADVPDEMFFILGGAASIVLGLFMMSWPAAGPVVLVIFFGAYALGFGMAMMGLALKLRDLTSRA